MQNLQLIHTVYQFHHLCVWNVTRAVILKYHCLLIISQLNWNPHEVAAFNYEEILEIHVFIK